MLIWPPLAPACSAAAGVGAAVAAAAGVGFAAAAGAGAVVGAGPPGATAGPHAATSIPSADTPALAAIMRRNARRLGPRPRGRMSGFSRCDRVCTVLVLLACKAERSASRAPGAPGRECEAG